MSAYCSADQLLELIASPNVTAWPDAAGESSIPTEARVEEIIAGNSTIIDGFCRGRYTVPFDPVPADIEKICLSLCLGDLLPTIHLGGDKGKEQGERATRERKWAMDLLVRIQDGRYSVEEGDDASQNASGGPVIVTAAPTARVFSITDEH